MSQQAEQRAEQQRVARIIHGVIIRVTGLDPKLVTNWTVLGPQHEQIVRQVSMEVGQVVGPGMHPSSSTTMAELIGMFT